jgi:hypothetical protein
VVTERLVWLPVLALAGCSLLVPLDDLSGGVSASDGSPGCRANLTKDRDNCGACGHSCLGGDCVMAQCQPVNIASDQNSPLGISVSSIPKHADYVFWVNQSPPSLWRARKDGSSPEPQAMTTGLVQIPFDIAVDENYLYWSEVKDRQVYRRPLDGGGMRMSWRQPGSDAGFIDVEAPEVYVSTYEPASSQGVIATGIVLYMGPFVGGGLAVRSQVIYWIRQESNTIVKGPSTGGGLDITTEVAKTSERAMGLAVDREHVYWIEGSRLLMRAPVSGNATPTTVYEARTTFGDSDVAVDDSAIYWTEQKNGLVRRLAK